MSEYKYRDPKKCHNYTPALPPLVLFKRSAIGELMVCIIGSLYIIDHGDPWPAERNPGVTIDHERGVMTVDHSVQTPPAADARPA